nr:hypothetical protein [Mucilaginibacter sp. X5P1]
MIRKLIYLLSLISTDAKTQIQYQQIMFTSTNNLVRLGMVHSDKSI